MSVVLSYIDKRKLIFASDGLATDEKGNIAGTGIQKILRLNANVILGYAGHLSSCLHIMNFLTNPSPENKPLVDSMYVEDVSSFINLCILNYRPLKCSFLIGGIGKKHIPCFSCIGSDSPENIRYITGDDAAYFALYPDEVPRNQDLFLNRLYQFPANPRLAMGLTIDDVSKLSPTVNTEHFFEEMQF